MIARLSDKGKQQNPPSELTPIGRKKLERQEGVYSLIYHTTYHVYANRNKVSYGSIPIIIICVSCMYMANCMCADFSDDLY